VGVDERGQRLERVGVEVDLCDGSKMVVEWPVRSVLASEELHKAQHFAALERFRVRLLEVQKGWKHDDHRLEVLHQEMGYV